jgi:RNA polymerase sigma-70 factor (ECF subfamily)
LEEKNKALTFEEIYEEYSERVLNLAYRFTADEELSRDLTQDIFIKIYENLDRFEQRSNIYTWIHRIAVNHILNTLKRKNRYKWLNVLDIKITDIFHQKIAEQGFISRTVSADKKLEESQRTEIIWNAVQSLPSKLRIPFVLFNWERMSYKEIAKLMELSMSAVESRIHRAKKQLIKKLETWVGNI